MQQINLHQPAARRNHDTLSARSAGTAVAAIALALLLMWGFAHWQVHRLRKEAAIARTQMDAQRTMAASQSSQLEQLSEEELDVLIAKLTATVETRSRAVTMIGSGAPKSAAFADRLAALSRRHIEGVWLDRLTLGASTNIMSLSGTVLTPDLVPRYLQSLALDPALRGSVIDNFIIDRSPASNTETTARLRFRAASRAAPPLTEVPAEG
jgi:hypothetical protein